VRNFDYRTETDYTERWETRKEKGESYSAIRGFFRQYELYYVVADEGDVVRRILYKHMAVD
jgi:hypothetical protein